MDDVSAVQVFQGLRKLIDDVFDVHVLEDAFGDDVVQVCLHILENQVYVFIIVSLYCLV